MAVDPADAGRVEAPTLLHAFRASLRGRTSAALLDTPVSSLAFLRRAESMPNKTNGVIIELYY